MNIGAVVMELLDLLFKEKDHISAVDWNRLVEFRYYVHNQWIVKKSAIAKAFLRSEPKPEFVLPPHL